MSDTEHKADPATAVANWPKVLDESFSNTPEGWSFAATTTAPPLRFDAPGVAMTLPGGVTSVGAYWYTQKKFGDLSLKVTLVLTASEAPSQSYCGVSFRAQSDRDNYRLFLDGDGFYRLTRRANNISTALVDWTASSAIATGAGARNRLRVVALGPEITIFVNGEKLTTVTDDSFLNGHVALQAQGGSETTETATVFLFQDFELAAPT